MPNRKPLTLYLTEAEMKILDELCAQKHITKTSALRQALRLYQLMEAKLAQGEKLFFGTDGDREKAELMLL